jgi:hypothetical protein
MSGQHWFYNGLEQVKFSLTLSMVEEPEGHPRFLIRIAIHWCVNVQLQPAHDHVGRGSDGVGPHLR